jgi:hypothetical protein
MTRRISAYLKLSGRRDVMLEYKVVEVSTVSEDILEEVLNEWTGAGWTFEGMQFAMRESSRRPSMAFVIFTRESETKGSE